MKTLKEFIEEIKANTLEYATIDEPDSIEALVLSTIAFIEERLTLEYEEVGWHSGAYSVAASPQTLREELKS